MLKNLTHIKTGVPEVWKYSKGKDVKIAVLDTGCSFHKDLNKNIIKRISFIKEESPIDENGHGTMVCGIICANGEVCGVAPEAKVISIKVARKDGTTSYEYIKQGIYDAILEDVDLINISIGGNNYDDDLYKAIKYATLDKYTPIICAAGNDGHMLNMSLIDYPAKFKETIAVGAYDLDKKEAALYTTYGEEIDFAAPGNNILTTALSNSYKEVSGTSFAAPFLCGISAIIMSGHKEREEREKIKNDCKSPSELKRHLIMYSIDEGEKGKDDLYGYGIININKLIKKEYNQASDCTLFRKLLNFLKNFFI